MSIEVRKKVKTSYIYLLSALIIGLFFIVLFAYRREKVETIKSIDQQPNMQIKEKGANFNIKSASSQQIFSEGQDFALLIFADSAGESIVAYDFVLQYNNTTTKYKEVISLHPGFDIFPSLVGDKIYVTGAKKLQTADKLILKDDLLAKIIFTPKKRGPLNFKPIFSINKTDDSNMLNTSSSDILQYIQIPVFYIGSEVVLAEKDIEYTTDDLSISLKNKSSKPKKNCEDCVSQISLFVKSGDKEKIIDFISGGLSGQSKMSEVFNGYIIEATSIDNGIIRFTKM